MTTGTASKRCSTGGRNRLRLSNFPRYRAYRLRATAESVVPLMIARPSGNNVISYGVGPELQDEIIVPHLAMRFQPLAHFREIDRPVALVNLHRVSPAKCDVGSAFAFEMDKIALAAGSAAWSWIAGIHLGPFIAPDIERKQGPPQLVVCAHQQLDCLCCRDRSSQVHR